MILQQLLHKAGLKHSDVAQHIGVAASTVGHYCTGRRLLAYKVALEVSEFLALHGVKCSAHTLTVSQERKLPSKSAGCDEKIALLARCMVNAAVKRGIIPSLKVGDVACVDCGGVADRYDHRNYARPLDVEPVCAACNQLRGAGCIEIAKAA